MIRSLKLIVLLGLIKATLPGHTFEFFNGCMQVAQMDIFDGAGLYEKWFTFKETSSVSDNFRQFGY